VKIKRGEDRKSKGGEGRKGEGRTEGEEREERAGETGQITEEQQDR
jgi:hypothetical protein